MLIIRGLGQADVLAALYNAARPQGMGFLHYDPRPMTRDEAAALLDGGQRHFDYCKGRVMKISIPAGAEEIDVRSYDRDNGHGSADLVIKSLHAGFGPDNEVTRMIHRDGMEGAASSVRGQMQLGAETVESPTHIEIRLGLADMKDKLGPAVDRAVPPTSPDLPDRLLSIVCRFCGKQYDLKVRLKDVTDWRGGKYIQEAFPYLSAAERELLISKTCNSCFDKMFKEVDEEGEE